MKKSGKGPKLGKRAQALLAKQSSPSPSKNDLITVEDYIEEGALEEESGDRWLGSDLAKALRFYQRAYSHYHTAISLQPSMTTATSISHFDGYYNACRLLFHVYNIYFKTDGVSVYRLPNVDDALTGDATSVIQHLSDILASHEQACQLIQSLGLSISQDLLYNTCLVYTEVIETEQENIDTNDFSKICQVGFKTQQLFNKLLQLQVNDLYQFLTELNQANDDINISIPPQSQQLPQQTEEQYTSENVLQPPDILETAISALKLAQAILENISHPLELQLAIDTINPFIQSVTQIINDLLSNFSEVNNKQPDLVSSITSQQIEELHLVQTYIEGLSINDLNQLYTIWSNLKISTPEYHMLAADNIQSLLDRNDLTLQSVNLNSNLEIKAGFWKALSQMNTHYSQAQQLLNATITEKRKTRQEEGLGSLISQLSEVVIARSDIDLQRSQLNYESAIKNSNVLLQNSKTFCKSAMNIANTAGGLRERALEKLQREQKKLDAVFRMCLLEGKITLQELDNIMGRERWLDQLPGILKLGYFDQFGIHEVAALLKSN